MKRTARPLKLCVVHPVLFNTVEVQGLQDKGHTVDLRDLSEYDAVIGPQCWRILPMMGKLAAYLTMMLKAVRAIKYPKKEGT